MNYRIEKTKNGSRWVKQIYNEETEKIEETLLEIGEKLEFSPGDFLKGSSIFLFKEREHRIATNGEGDPLSFEEFMESLIKDAEKREFQPSAFYNKTGDILHIYWSDEEHFVEHLKNGVEVMRSFDRKKIVGANVWGIKRLLLEAYANAEPEQFIGIKSYDPNCEENKDVGNS